jgi:hypothetical protein
MFLIYKAAGKKVFFIAITLVEMCHRRTLGSKTTDCKN